MRGFCCGCRSCLRTRGAPGRISDKERVVQLRVICFADFTVFRAFCPDCILYSASTHFRINSHQAVEVGAVKGEDGSRHHYVKPFKHRIQNMKNLSNRISRGMNIHLSAFFSFFGPDHGTNASKTGRIEGAPFKQP